MNFNDIVNYKIIHTENIVLTPYHILMILVVLIATHFIVKLIRKLLNKLVTSQKLDYSRSYTFQQILKYLLWVFAISFSLQSIGLNMSLLIASSAALFVGLGLGLQEIFRDMVSGIMIIFEDNLKVGDVIELNGVVGKVKQIGLRTSKIINRDNIVLIIPNSQFITDAVINWSDLESFTRFNVDVGVAYSSDIKLVEKILLTCASETVNISKSRNPFVRLKNFGDSSIDFQLFFWTKSTFRVEETKSKLRFKIIEQFRNNNIEIPFPQNDVYIKRNDIN